MLRARPLWRTTWAARSSVRPTVCARGAAEKRSTPQPLPAGAGVTAGVSSRGVELTPGALGHAHMQPVGDLAGIRPG